MQWRNRFRKGTEQKQEQEEIEVSIPEQGLAVGGRTMPVEEQSESTAVDRKQRQLDSLHVSASTTARRRTEEEVVEEEEEGCCSTGALERGGGDDDDEGRALPLSPVAKAERLGGRHKGVLDSDPKPRKRTLPKELYRADVLKERDGNILRDFTLSEGGREDDLCSSLNKSTDKLHDILQFLKKADTNIDSSSDGKDGFDSVACVVNSVSLVSSCQSQSLDGGARSFENAAASADDRIGATRGEGQRESKHVGFQIPDAKLVLSQELRGGGPSSAEAQDPNVAINVMCSGVHSKIRGLHNKIQSQKESLTELERQVEEGKRREKKLECGFLERITQALDKQSKEHETSLKRHLNFIDRILKDKDLLSKKCEKLAEELKSLEDMYNKKIERLQTQWAIELKKQKEVWQSAEKARREAWLSEKTREIKEMTIKGLEPEIQRLIQKSKSDLEDLESKHVLETRKKVDECKEYYDSYIHSLRDQWRREKDDLVEHERSTASNRLREQGDRYDSQMESLRMRLVSDFDSKLASLETLKREDNARSENTIMRLKQEQAAEISKLNQDFEGRLQLLDRSNDTEKERMREKFEAEQEGWRQMIVKKIRQEYDQKEEEMRARFGRERKSELELIVSKLEEEAQLSRESNAKEFENKVKAMKEKHSKEVKELKESNLKFSEKYREAAQLSQSNQKEISSIQSLNKASTRELEVKAETISFLEKQLATSRKEAEGKEKDIRSMYEDKIDILLQKSNSFAEKSEKSERKLEEANCEINRLKAKSKQDMVEVEARVKEAITKRENLIAHLQNQLLSLQQNLEETEDLMEAK